MKLNADIRDIPWKKVSAVIVILLVIAGIAVAMLNSKNKGPQHPLTPEANRIAVTKYLQERAQVTDFVPVMEAMQEKSPWNTLKPRYDSPPDYKTVYRNIGEDLVIAEELIKQTSARDQVLGLRMVTDLCEIAISIAVDPWLAARICDGYLMPNLDKVEEKPKNGPSREQFMSQARRIYKEADETDRLIELSKNYLAQNPPPDRADKIRWGLARELEQRGETKEALKYFREISHSSLTNEASRRISNLEQRLSSSKQ